MNQFLKGARLDLLTSSTSLSFSWTLLLKDSISANSTMKSDRCSWILRSRAASSLNLSLSALKSSSFCSVSEVNRVISSLSINSYVSAFIPFRGYWLGSADGVLSASSGSVASSVRFPFSTLLSVCLAFRTRGWAERVYFIHELLLLVRNKCIFCVLMFLCTLS